MKKNAELAPKTSAVPAVELDTLCQNAIQLIQYARHTAARQINTVQLMTFTPSAAGLSKGSSMANGGQNMAGRS